MLLVAVLHRRGAGKGTGTMFWQGWFSRRHRHFGSQDPSLLLVLSLVPPAMLSANHHALQSLPDLCAKSLDGKLLHASVAVADSSDHQLQVILELLVLLTQLLFLQLHRGTKGERASEF